VLICTALASMLLIAPSIHHRIEFRQRDKEFLVVTANRLTIGGLTLLAIAMTGAITLITHMLFGTTATVITTATIGLGFAAVWFAIPLRRLAVRRRHAPRG